MTFDFDQHLPKDVFEKIIEICKNGNEHFSKRDYTQAINEFSKAITLIPPTQDVWHAYVWLTMALAESYFLNENYLNAEPLFLELCELAGDESVNPLVQLRLAQIHYKLGNIKQAESALIKSLVPYDISELDDPVYWDIIKGVTIRDDTLPFNTLA